MNELEQSAIEITDDQRTRLIQFFDEHPDSGYKTAVRTIGHQTNDARLARVTKAEAEALVKGDDDIADAVLKALKIDRPTLLKTIGEMAADPEHRDRFRATTFALAAVHGMTDQSSKVELTGPDGGPMEVNNPDVAAAIERFTGTVVRLAARGRAELPPAATSE